MKSVDDIIETIKKALRLAQKAGTEGERVAAEAAAKRLADAHGINLSNVSVTDAEAKATMRGDERLYPRKGAEVGFACNLIREHFGVVVMQTYRRGDRKMRLTFFGVNINIEIAKYVYDILIREFTKAWGEAKGWGLDKRAFMTGWFKKLDIKLTANPIRNDIDQFRAEAEAAEKKFKEYCDSKRNSGNPVKDKETKMSHKDAEALYRGFMEADRVSLRRPCEGRATPSPFTLGHTPALKGGL